MQILPAIVVTVVTTAIIVASIVVPITYYARPDQNGKSNNILADPLPENERFDCHPEDGATEAGCSARECIWDDSPGSTGPPHCYYPADYGAYRLLGTPQEMTWGYRVRLQRLDVPTMFGKDAIEVLLDLEYQRQDRLRFKFYDPLNPRYEVPVEMPSPLIKASNPLYDVQFVNEPFSMQIIRIETNEVLWNTSVGGFTFSDQFLSISTRLPSQNIYGFGEHEHPSFRHDMSWLSWGMFSRDQPPSYLGNLYGVHPFYTCLEEDTKSHGVLLMNSNAMDITVQPLPALTYRTIGGILDFWMFLGPTPENVVEQYTEAIGRPYMPPYWTLGFQLCRYGYNSLDRVKEVVAGMRQYDIPHDVQYGDIDYMERQLDFTYDLVDYNGLPEYVDELKLDGTHYISILDPAISVNETLGTYHTYENGSAEAVFITEEDGQTELLGKVWPDPPNIEDIMNEIDCQGDWDCEVENYRAHAVFPDWVKPGTSDWWVNEAVDFHKTLAFDGLWIDMNEPANFVTGSTKGCDYENPMESPPYKPRIFGSVLADKTVCMAAPTYDTATSTTTQYNMHSLFGLTQSEPSLRAARSSTGKRSLVISRSTFPSSGKYVGHWLGDNTSIWPHMHKSIIGMLEFGLFGIPYIGADICGFFGDTTDELCRRWMQLGAFYPYCRNHNGLGYIPQDPAAFGPDFANAARDVLHIRYTLLPYLYTLFYDAHTRGPTVVRSLMHEFASDSVTWTIDRQFLWGGALLITPVLDEGMLNVDAYFPDTRWFDYYTGAEIPASNRGNYVNLNAPLEFIPLHIRGGYIIPTQQPANSTVFSRELPFGLTVALGDDYTASGTLFWDDGDTIDTIENNQYFLERFDATEDQVNGAIMVPLYTMDPLVLDDVTVLGLSNIAITRVELESVVLDPLNWSVDEGNMKLMVNNLKHPIDTGFKLTWFY